jgi:hypothetical protein
MGKRAAASDLCDKNGAPNITMDEEGRASARPSQRFLAQLS